MARNYPFLLQTVRSSGKGAWETGMPLGSQAHHAPHRMAAARQAIGRFLKSTRQTMRLSQAQVAVLASRNSLPLSRAAISAIERGLHLPSLEALLTYWNALLFPFMVVSRKLLPGRAGGVTLYPLPIDAVCRAATAFETALLRVGLRFPFGGSVLAIAAKEGVANG